MCVNLAFGGLTLFPYVDMWWFKVDKISYIHIWNHISIYRNPLYGFSYQYGKYIWILQDFHRILQASSKKHLQDIPIDHAPQRVKPRGPATTAEAAGDEGCLRGSAEDAGLPTPAPGGARGIHGRNWGKICTGNHGFFCHQKMSESCGSLKLWPAIHSEKQKVEYYRRNQIDPKSLCSGNSGTRNRNR